MRLKIHVLAGLACAAALMGTPVFAQQTPDQTQDPNTGAEQPSQPAQPIPAIRSPLAGLSGNDQDEVPAQRPMVPDTNPLSGVESLTLGHAPFEHNYIQPHFEIFTTADSDELSTSGNNSGWGDFTSFLGGLDLHQIKGTSNLNLSYLGGGTFAIGGDAGSSTIQQLNVSEALTWRRLQLQFIDQLGLLPESSFGYSGIGGGIALPGGGSTGLQTGITPGDSVLTARGLRLSNSSLVQADFYLTPRSSITVAGGYSFLHYFDNQLLNFGDSIFQAGYNRQMTRKDTIAIFYRFSGYRYSGVNQSINDNSFQLSYGRRITGRLVLQFAGGPDVVLVTQPLTTTSTGGTPVSGQTTQLYYSVSANARYQLERAGFSASFSHGVSGGSGVLAGSISDLLQGSADRRLTRDVSGGVVFGYSHNDGVNVLTTTTPTNQTYGYWFGGANVSRHWGRALDINLSYQIQYQTSSADFCVGLTCTNNLVRHQVSVGLNWQGQPRAF